MIIDRQTIRLRRMLGPVAVAAGCCLFAGCGTTSGPGPGSFDLARTPLSKLGSSADGEAFRKRVQNDRFPTAAQALAESSLTATSGPP